jgi:CBS domain-containing protein
MATDVIYAFRVMRLALLDANGGPVGKIEDVVVRPPDRLAAPPVIGFVASSQRRHIFVNASRIELTGGGARLRSGTIDLDHFRRRTGELLIGRDLLNRRIGDEVVLDVALRPSSTPADWEVGSVVLGSRSGLRRRRTSRVVSWTEVRSLFDQGEVAAEVARFRRMHPSDVARVVRLLPLPTRRALAEAMEDERLADLLEELPEAEQLRLIEGLDLDRLVGVLEEMEADDAADLLAEMPQARRAELLDAMDDDDAGSLRRLLAFAKGTVGHAMTPDPIVLGPQTTVAEALARIRDPDYLPTESAQVFVAQPPWVTPTGPFLGVVHFQRLLREPPSMQLGKCIDPDTPVVGPDQPEREAAAILAAYNLVAVAVVDGEGRLVGAVTIDDVLDRALPGDWRLAVRQSPRKRGGSER